MGVCEQRWELITSVFSENRLCVQTPRLESNRGIDQLGLKWLITEVPDYSQKIDRLDLSDFHFQVWPEDRETKTN